MIKAILFDWHGVLDRRTFGGMLEKIAEAWYPIFAPTRIERKEISFEEYKQMIKENWRIEGVEYALGRISPKNFWLGLECEEETGVETAKNYLLSVEKNEVLWSAIPLLKRRYKLAILSDCPVDKVRIIRETCDLSYFQGVYFSSDYRMLKENPEFFRIAMSGMNTKPEECVFVDDAEVNIRYAQQAGLQTCLYRNNSDLEKRLRH